MCRLWLMILMGYIKSRVELSVPTNDWKRTWRWARLKGLGSAATSILWKLVHQLFPTEDRLARILPASDPGCKLCHTPAPADLVHCLFQCVSTREMGSKLISLISTHDPLTTPRKLLLLDFEAEANAEMALVWVTAQTLLYMWGIRWLSTLLSPVQLWRAKYAF